MRDSFFIFFLFIFLFFVDKTTEILLYVESSESHMNKLSIRGIYILGNNKSEKNKRLP